MTRKTPVVKDAIPDIEDLEKNTETAENSISNQTETVEKKPEPTNQLKKNLLKNELKNDVIPRKKMGRPKKEVLRNEKGERLTKKGTVDKRGETGLQNLQKSRVYQQILENKKLKEETKGKVAILTPIVDDDTSEDDVEFVIEEDPDIKEEKTRTQLYLQKQEQIREQELKEQLKKYEDENKALKEKFNYNSHLNKISHMASNVKLKF